VGRRCGAGQYRHRQGEEPSGDGQGVQRRGGRRSPRLPCRPCGDQPGGGAVVAAGRVAGELSTGPPRNDAELRARRFDSGGPTVADVGESGLLSLLLERDHGDGRGVIVGPGDDAAVWRPPAGMSLVTTQDVLVEDVDFRRAWTAPYLLGRRALTISLSDLAAMGARPALCMASLCLPPRTCVDDVAALHLGILDAASDSGCRLVGGDLSATAGPLVIDSVAIGTVEEGLILRRDAGRPGDVLAVTGVLGRAAAGLRLLSGAEPAAPSAGVAETWRKAQLAPVARLDEGLRLAASGVRCAGDLSDGLLVDAGRTAVGSGCAADLWLDRIPVDAELRHWVGDSWVELALGGGEDFELLVAASEQVIGAVSTAWPARLAPITVIGRLRAGTGVHLYEHQGGAERPLPPVHSRHFA
jgi:thiamine-monophosphate kinase